MSRHLAQPGDTPAATLEAAAKPIAIRTNHGRQEAPVEARRTGNDQRAWEGKRSREPKLPGGSSGKNEESRGIGGPPERRTAPPAAAWAG